MHFKHMCGNQSWLIPYVTPIKVGMKKYNVTNFPEITKSVKLGR